MQPVARPSIVILHGANGTGAIMQPLGDELQPHVDSFAPNMLGHGGREIPERPSTEDFARDVLAQMDAHGLGRTYIFGFSTGGIMALYLARHHPERFIGVTTLAAKYVFDQRTVSHWTHVADPVRLARPGNKRAEELARDHHPQDWTKVTLMIQQWFFDLGEKPPLREDELRSISLPALLFASNQDQIVPFNETLELARLIPGAKAVIFHGQCHPFHVVPVAAMGKAISNWIGEIERMR
jgi:pimeloyl-ACP methyl ester carboxylesterase